MKICVTLTLILAIISFPAFAEDIELKGDIDPVDGGSWEISFQGKHVESGSYLVAFPGGTSERAALCSSGFSGFDLSGYEIGNMDDLECTYTSYSEAIGKLVSELHALADATEST